MIVADALNSIGELLDPAMVFGHPDKLKGRVDTRPIGNWRRERTACAASIFTPS